MLECAGSVLLRRQDQVVGGRSTDVGASAAFHLDALSILNTNLGHVNVRRNDQQPDHSRDRRTKFERGFDVGARSLVNFKNRVGDQRQTGTRDEGSNLERRLNVADTLEHYEHPSRDATIGGSLHEQLGRPHSNVDCLSVGCGRWHSRRTLGEC